MATDLETTSIAGTLAELVERLGDVPLSRIRMLPSPGTATEEDVLRAAAALDKRLCELVDGVLVEKAMGFPESLLAAFLVEYLRSFVKVRKLGIVTGSDGMVRVLPEQVRIPDVSFFSWDRLPGRRIPTAPVPALAPDLAIEVISPGNTAGEMRRKRRDYFSAGVLEIWEIFPPTRTVDVYHGLDDIERLAPPKVLTTPLLPGFSLPVSELFAVLDEQG